MLLQLILAASLPATAALVTAAPLQAPDAGVKSSDAPASPDAAIEAGLKAFARHRYTQAEIEFRRAVEAAPDSAAAHFYLGYTNYKMGEPSHRMNEHKQKARDEFARAFELDPRFRPAWAKAPTPAPATK